MTTPSPYTTLSAAAGPSAGESIAFKAYLMALPGGASSSITYGTLCQRAGCVQWYLEESSTTLQLTVQYCTVTTRASLPVPVLPQRAWDGKSLAQLSHATAGAPYIIKAPGGLDRAPRAAPHLASVSRDHRRLEVAVANQRRDPEQRLRRLPKALGTGICWGAVGPRRPASPAHWAMRQSGNVAGLEL